MNVFQDFPCPLLIPARDHQLYTHYHQRYVPASAPQNPIVNNASSQVLDWKCVSYLFQENTINLPSLADRLRYEYHTYRTLSCLTFFRSCFRLYSSYRPVTQRNIPLLSDDDICRAEHATPCNQVLVSQTLVVTIDWLQTTVITVARSRHGVMQHF